MSIDAPVVVGLDLSITATGVATVRDDGKYTTRSVVPGVKRKGHDRLEFVLQGIFTAEVKMANAAVVEGPSFGSNRPGYHVNAGLWWHVTHRLWLHGIPYVVVAPTVVKMYATGNGQSGKDAVLMSAARKFPQFDGDNNEADALWMAALFLDWSETPLVGLPQKHRRALASVDWPERE